MLCHFSPVQLFTTPWTIARQAPLSVGFSRHEYCSGLPCPPPGTLPDPGIKTTWVLYHYCLLRSPDSNVDGQNSSPAKPTHTAKPWEDMSCQHLPSREAGRDPISTAWKEAQVWGCSETYKEHSPASPQNLCLVLTADSDVMTKGYAHSEHDHRAEEQRAPCVLRTQSCQRLLALVFLY